MDLIPVPSSVTAPFAQSDVTGLVADLAAKQPLDATLTALAGVTVAADQIIYATGADAFAAAPLTAAARTFLALNVTTGNVLYASGTDTWAQATPNTAGLVDLTTAQTIAGNKSFTGLGSFTNASFPPLRTIRTSASTNAASNCFAVQHLTTGDMIDGFGSSFVFEIRDNAGVNNIIGSLAFVRSGGDDTTGDFIIVPRVAAGILERFRIKAVGRILGNVAGTMVTDDGTTDFQTGSIKGSTGTFTGAITVLDAAYNSTTWNSSTEVPTKNAVRDKIEGLAPAASPVFTGTPVFASGDNVSPATTVQQRFQWSGGGFPHYITSRHVSGSSTGNAIDFYTCDGVNGVYPTNAILGLTISRGRIGVNKLAPAVPLDVVGDAAITGALSAAGGTKTAPSLSIFAVGNGFYGGSDYVAYATGGAAKFFFQANSTRGHVLGSDMPVSWATTTDAILSVPDVYIRRSAANTLMLDSNGAGGAASLAVTGAVTAASLNLGGATVLDVLSATAALNFGSILAGSSADLTIAVTGAIAGDTVHLGRPAAEEAGLVTIAICTAADTVTVRAHNVNLTVAIDQASLTYRATVVRI